MQILAPHPPNFAGRAGRKKNLKIIIALPDRCVKLISFWGEQKPVATLVATGFNFYRSCVFRSFATACVLTGCPL